MLGTDSTSFYLLSIQTHIIALFPNKINPLFSKNLQSVNYVRADIIRPYPYSPGTYTNAMHFPAGRLIAAPALLSAFLCRKRFPCQAQIFAQIRLHGKNHDPRKNGKTGERRRLFLCEPKMDIHNSQPLWKTPVEKPVENVENSELSTVISSFWFSTASCGEICIRLCIMKPEVTETACYVTASGIGFLKETAGKSLQYVKKRCQISLPPGDGKKFFVENRQKFFPVSSFRKREYLGQVHENPCHCEKGRCPVVETPTMTSVPGYRFTNTIS